MLKLLKILTILLSFLLLISCSSTIRQTNKNFKWPRDSFVKYEAWIIKQECHPNEPNNLESECYEKERGYTGSGSIIANGFDGSYILAAAHMCDQGEELKLLKKEDEKDKSSEGNIFFAKHFVRDLDDLRYNAEIVAYDIDLDACIVFAWGLFKDSLAISKEDPKIGSKVFNIAAPAGFFKKNLVPLFDGFYIGKWDKYSSVYTIPAVGGSSGSPILNNRGELIGLIYARHNRFHHIVISPDLKKLRKFILESVNKSAKERSRKHGLDLRRSIIIKFNN